MKRLTAKDRILMMTSGIANLCLLILVCGILILVSNKTLAPEMLGTVTGASTGGGLLGLGVILYRIIRITISPGAGS